MWQQFYQLGVIVEVVGDGVGDWLVCDRAEHDESARLQGVGCDVKQVSDGSIEERGAGREVRAE
jgi:hypothetical protein